MTPISETDLARIIDEINAYLADRPNASDSYKGIFHWWIKRYRLDISEQLVEQALQKLVEEGILSRSYSPSGEAIYKHVSH